MLNEFIIKPNEYLQQAVRAFYRTDYTGYNQPNNPDYINVMKNTFNSTPVNELNHAVSALHDNMINELNYIYQNISVFNEKLYICIVPRAKALENYQENQLAFRNYFKSLFGESPRIGITRTPRVTFTQERLPHVFGNGIDFIIRHTDTKTTHLSRSNIENNGEMPYVGITKDTCHISPEIKGKNILLIDDIYTRTVNIDEDALQCLLDHGAKSVTLFAIAKTAPRNRFDLSMFINQLNSNTGTNS